MSKSNTGGPVFPVAYSNDADGPTVMPSQGINLRDFFALKTMQSLVAANNKFRTGAETIAVLSYEQADAMLRIREFK